MVCICDTKPTTTPIPCKGGFEGYRLDIIMSYESIVRYEVCGFWAGINFTQKKNLPSAAFSLTTTLTNLKNEGLPIVEL